MQNKFDELRNIYPHFIYNGFTVTKEDSSINIEYDFEIEGLCRFHPTTRIKTDNLNILNQFNSITAQKIIFNLGMVELVSYWKCCCPKQIIVKCFPLDQQDKYWWKKLYYNGLQEFFYRNEITIDFDNFVEIIADEPKPLPDDIYEYQKSGINIIPVGGGKDSNVTMELLKELKDKNMCFTVNDQPARTESAQAAGYDESKIIKTYRTIDRELIKLNGEGFLNGHTPFSAIVAFLSLYCAYLTGSENIILSNESSANESNIEGTEINHQYSKSFEFENDFNDYIIKNITGEIRYFSLLRAFNELQIAKQFSILKKYHGSFKSCNAGSKKNIWCCNCAKCLFVYIILSPFLSEDELIDIFGENLLQKDSLKEIFDGLVGFSDIKPFECIGTKKEINTALAKTYFNLKSKGEELPNLLQYYSDKMVYFNTKKFILVLKEFNEENNIPDKFKSYVMEMYKYVSETC